MQWCFICVKFKDRSQEVHINRMRGEDEEISEGEECMWIQINVSKESVTG